MVEIDWTRDYKYEFVCPSCDKLGLRLRGKDRNNQRRFGCPCCRKKTSQSCRLNLSDSFSQVNWKQDYRVGEFICPHEDCQSKKMFMGGWIRQHKKNFKCADCGRNTMDSCDLKSSIVSRLSKQRPGVKPFSFEEDKWDLRSILSSYSERTAFYCLYFDKIQPDWFKKLVKEYIYHLAKLDTPSSTIEENISSLRIFSRYLSEQKITGIEKIDRSLILDFMSWDKTTNNARGIRLGVLRKFFLTGTLRGWFEVDQDLIRDDDYPKRKLKTPDPISDCVREQIERNLHQLPDPFARMWLISFFAAMRPAELALLKKDCLVQEGGTWKILFDRPKNREEQRQIFITRTIAEVVQAQQAYIQELWGDEWDYMFCHYRGLSNQDPAQAKLEPLKRVLPESPSILSRVIRCLIKAEDIRDENGELAKFSHRLVRATRLSQLYNLGHDLTVVQRWAGHKRAVTTARYYTKISPEKFRREIGHIQQAFFNAEGKYVAYESLPKSFWENRKAHQLHPPDEYESLLAEYNMSNTPIYGYCSQPLDDHCDKFRACYSCRCFVATPEKLSQYIQLRDKLRERERESLKQGKAVLVEQFKVQADQLDKIIAGLEGAA